MRQKGFSLIEIMVVVVILGILASFIVPQIMKRPEQARLIKAQQDILAIENALDLYKLDTGEYPTNAQGLNALVKKPASSENWQQYLKKLPKDPWGKNYNYQHPGENGEIDIFTTHNDKLIGNWDDK